MGENNPETPVKETAEHVAEVVPEPPAPVKETTDHPSDEIPHWAKELKDTVNSLSETVNSLVAKGAEGVPVVEDIVPDEKPVKKPWTHRNPFN